MVKWNKKQQVPNTRGENRQMELTKLRVGEGEARGRGNTGIGGLELLVFFPEKEKNSIFYRNIYSSFR